MDVFIRTAPKGKTWVAWCKEEYDPNSQEMMYRTYASGKELLPPSSDLEFIKDELRKRERTFIEQEIKYKKEHGPHAAPRMLTKRLRELNKQQARDTQPDGKDEQSRAYETENHLQTNQQLAAHKKTNTMNTQTEKPKNEKPVSRLYIVEQGTWKNGQEVLTFYYKNEQGKPKAIAHSFVYYDKEGQTFRTQDAKGNEIFPPCANRYDLKKYALDNEQDLIQKFEKTQGQEKTPLQQNAQTPKQPEQVQQPVNNPEQPKRSARQKNNSRKNELGEIRNEKDGSEKEQSISR
ncbi:MAG: hypothetical protein ABIS12_14195 [Bacteroidia bacterium]